MQLLKTNINSFDLHLTRAVRAWPNRLTPVMRAATLVGEPVTVSIVIVSIIITSYFRKTHDVTIIAAAVFASQLISAILKTIWHRTRPDTAKALGLRTYSFPSGHAYGSTIIYGLLAFLAYSHIQAPWSSIFPILATALIISIGLSRVYLGAHYPTDVVGGWVLGIVILTIIIKLSHI